MNHVLSYVRRSVITDWKRQVFREDEPLFVFGSNDRRVIPHMQAGDHLWIISGQPDGPPSLVARIVVDWVTPAVDVMSIPAERLNPFRIWTWIVRGTDESEFFGYNDASGALLNTVFCSQSGRPRVLSASRGPWSNALGLKLQAPTLIFPAGKPFGKWVSQGSAPLETLAARKALSVFMSYKWKDGNQALVLAAAQALERAGLMPWLDQLALPRARASKRIAQNEVLLRRVLKYGYNQSTAVMGVYSPNYGVATNPDSGNWSRREWRGELDTACRKIKVLYNPDHMPLSPLVADRNVELTQPAFNELAAALKGIILQREAYNSG